MRYNFLLTLSLKFMTFQLVCAQQVTGRVFDGKTGEPLAFVSIVENGTVNGAYSDIDGFYNITLSESNAILTFSLLGYVPFATSWKGMNPFDIRLQTQEILTAEVTIRPGENPAERIIRNAISNKKKNNPESDVAFTYDSYNKLVFGAEIDSSLMADTARFAALDTNTRDMYNFMNEQYLFLMESATRRKFYPPDKSEETIIANRVSGLKTTDFFLLGTQLQSFSFYGETVDLLGVSYMSPLAENAINKYLFILEDTTYIGQDSVFTISFQPRRQKNFPAMVGQLFINSNGYALLNVIAEPRESETFTIKIQQQYEFVENRKWFPKQLNSSIIFKAFVNNLPLIGVGRSYIKNLKLDAPLRRSEFTPVTLLIAPDAGKQSDTVWNKYRERSLDTKELNTYNLIDSIGKAENFDRKLKLFEALTTGQINMGIVSFDLRRLMAYNQYEKFRLGGGLRTSNLLSEKFNFGGYYAYGFGDRHSKYGGDVLIHLYRKRNAWLKFEYSNDVKELGGNQLDKQAEGMGLMNIYPFFINRMDRRELMEVSASSRIIRNISTTFFGNTQFVRPYDTYRYITSASENIQLYTSSFQTTEAGVLIRYAPGEKLVHTTTREMRLGGRFPVFLVKYTRGLKDVLDGNYNYSRLDARIDKTFKILNVGQFSVAVVGGYSSDNIPLSLLYNARGTYDDFTIAAPGSFETMRTNEFRHSRFAALHLRHNFMDLLFKRKNFEPHLVLVHNMTVGDFEYTQNHNYDIKSASKGYYESGIQIDNLLVSSFSGIGIGVFYRYGPYHLPEMSDNFAFKLTTAIVF